MRAVFGRFSLPFHSPVVGVGLQGFAGSEARGMRTVFKSFGCLFVAVWWGVGSRVRRCRRAGKEGFIWIIFAAVLYSCVQGLGFGVMGGVGVQVLGFRVQGSGFRVQMLMVEGLIFNVEGVLCKGMGAVLAVW